PLPAEEQLEGLLELLDARLWMSVEGAWHVQQPWTIGEDVPGTSVAAQRYDAATGTLGAAAALAGSVHVARARTFDGRLRRGRAERVRAVEVVRRLLDIPEAPGGSVDLLLGGDAVNTAQWDVVS